VRASKHEGAGNDFIVVLDPDDTLRLSVGQVRLLCDRRRGVGADGIIVVGPARLGCDLSMELRNADSGAAEMSGNGIRCLAQAAVDGGLVSPPRFTVATAAGTRTVDFVAGESPGWARARVDMGPVTLGPDQPQDFEDRKARTADVGNPHLILLGPEVATVDLALLGPKLQSSFEGGINVEWICVARDDEGEFIDQRVWERAARYGCATPEGRSRSRWASGPATRRTWPVRCARWRTSTSTRACSRDEHLAGDPH
jgi:diaminopimelate epimerase